MMNERIEELAVEAFESIDYPFKQEINMPDVLVEKFAELIVRECVDVIQKEVSLKYKDGNDGLSDEWTGGHYGASLLARVMIKQHFGVEE